MYNVMLKYSTIVSLHVMILMCAHQEEEIKDLELQLDIRTKDLKTQEAMLFNQVYYSSYQKNRCWCYSFSVLHVVCC